MFSPKIHFILNKGHAGVQRQFDRSWHVNQPRIIHELRATNAPVRVGEAVWCDAGRARPFVCAIGG